MIKVDCILLDSFYSILFRFFIWIILNNIGFIPLGLHFIFWILLDSIGFNPFHEITFHSLDYIELYWIALDLDDKTQTESKNGMSRLAQQHLAK